MHRLLTFASLVLTISVTAFGQTNLLPNSSMEHWHSSSVRATGWGVWTPAKQRASWHVAKDQRISFHSQTSMRVEIDGWANMFCGSPVEPGQTYTYSVHVRCNQEATLQLRFSVWGEDVPPQLREGKARPMAEFQLQPNKWQRVYVTDTMPKGAQRATLYTFIRQKGVYHFDAGMLSAGDLQPYESGPELKPLAPVNSQPVSGQVGFTPKLWLRQGEVRSPQDLAFAFDDDPMTGYKIIPNEEQFGATFSSPIWLRGVYLIHDHPITKKSSAWKVKLLKNAQWVEVSHRPIQVGKTELLQFGYHECEAVMITCNLPAATVELFDVGFAR